MKNNEELKAFLANLIPSATIESGKQYPEVVVPLDEWHETAQKLRNATDTPFDYLVSLTAVDFVSKFSVVCHLESTASHDFIVVKAYLEERENPVIDTLTDVWATAEFLEREVFDLFGIRFSNHPDLRRLFLEEEYGFPLRKDFKDEMNIIELPN